MHIQAQNDAANSLFALDIVLNPFGGSPRLKQRPKKKVLKNKKTLPCPF